jgi:hypothetical protein
MTSDVYRRLQRLENSRNGQDSPEHGLSRLEILNKIYDAWLTGEPAGLPPPDPETARHFNDLYDRIVASQEDRLP